MVAAPLRKQIVWSFLHGADQRQQLFDLFHRRLSCLAGYSYMCSASGGNFGVAKSETVVVKRPRHQEDVRHACFDESAFTSWNEIYTTLDINLEQRQR